MSDITRRGFLGSVAAAVPVAAAARGKPTNSTRAGQAQGPLAPQLLGALGYAVLPSALGPDGVERVITAFQHWLRQYEPNAEMLHGYGTGEIAYSPDSPTPRWQSQLLTLDTISNQQFGVALGDLQREQLRQLVRTAIEHDRLDPLPSPSRARHVAVALLAFFYTTPEATDICYRATIGKNGCRPLAELSKRPEPMPHE
ncbi:MAG: hypothetical protein ACE5HT_10765 [Gemmatimonadales bacterium]